MIYDKISPALAALFFEYQRFPEATFASVNGTRPQPLYISTANRLQTTAEIYCDVEAQIENTQILNPDFNGGKILTGQIELDDIADLTERNDVHYIGCPMPDELTAEAVESNATEKKIVAAPGKYTPSKIIFIVPSSSQPGSPREVVLRGWFETEADCEITIFSPGGGATRSTQAEILAGNPTRYGNYHSSQAFLTKPKLAPDGRLEFFIDLRPIAPAGSVTGGTWKLVVVNAGISAVNLSVKSWVNGDATNINFP